VSNVYSYQSAYYIYADYMGYLVGDKFAFIIWNKNNNRSCRDY